MLRNFAANNIVILSLQSLRLIAKKWIIRHQLIPLVIQYLADNWTSTTAKIQPHCILPKSL